MGLGEVCSDGYTLRGEGALRTEVLECQLGGTRAVAGAPPKAAAQRDLRHRGPGARGLDAKLSPSGRRRMAPPARLPPEAEARPTAAWKGRSAGTRAPRPFPPRPPGPFPAPGTAPRTGLSGLSQALGQQAGPSGRSQARTSKTKT